MKKIKVLFVIIFILLFASWSKPREVNITDMEIREGITYVKGETKAFTGIIKSYYDNGALKEDTPYKDGKENGYYYLYNSNGTYRTKGAYSMGKPIGEWEYYDKDGKLTNKVIAQ